MDDGLGWGLLSLVGHHARGPRTDWCLGRAHPAQSWTIIGLDIMVMLLQELQTGLGIYLIGSEPRTMPLKFRARMALSACKGKFMEERA
jgi:hypothetical protein